MYIIQIKSKGAVDSKHESKPRNLRLKSKLYTIQKNTKGPTTQNESKPRSLRLSPKCISHTKKVYITKVFRARLQGRGRRFRTTLQPSSKHHASQRKQNPDSGVCLQRKWGAALESIRKQPPKDQSSEKQELGRGETLFRTKSSRPSEGSRSHLEGWNISKTRPPRRMEHD